MDNKQLDQQLVKRLPKVGPQSIPYHADGSIAWEKLPTKYFWLGIGGLLLIFGTFFLLVLGGFDFLGQYSGIAVQAKTKMCRPFFYHALVRNSRKDFPAPTGWKVYADIQDPKVPDYLNISTPYGQCTAETAQDCCQKDLQFQFINSRLGN